MHNIIIVGSGQLGSRHLQSLATLERPANIHIVDPSNESLDKAAEIFNSSKPNQSLQLFRHNSIDTIMELKIDLVIVATNSMIRRKVIEGLVEKFTIRYLILEKFLFPEVKDYEIVEDLITSANIRTWVNCPRRIYPVYQQLKKQINGPCRFIFSGTTWGLGCNAIHMLDLAAFITGNSDFVINGGQLDEEIQKSKREGYIEFAGTLTGYSNDKKHSLIFFSSVNEQLPFSISIQNNNKTYIITENLKKATIVNTTDQTIEVIDFELFYQSQLTGIVANRLLTTGTCDLTSYEESSKLHLAILSCLLKKLNIKSPVEIKKCPVT